MVATRALRSGTLLLALVGVGWLAARHAGAAHPILPAPAQAIETASDSVRIMVNSRLTPTALMKLGEQTAGTRALLVLLDSADVRTCEDLGRQLRELRNRAGAELPVFILADSEALVTVRTFARREHLLAAGLIAIPSGEVVKRGSDFPTPAVLIVRGGEVVFGVGHPRRFPNVRARSFADELSAYLPRTVGSPVSPDPRRLQ